MKQRSTLGMTVFGIGAFLAVSIALLVFIAILNTLAGGKTPLW